MDIKKRILNATDLKKESTYIPEWEAYVLVRELTALERQEVERKDFSRVHIAVRCLIDEDGNNIFSDNDITELQRKSSSVIDRISAIATRLSGIGHEYIDDRIENLALPTLEKFLFRLSLALGYSHPRHLLSELTSRDISDWIAYSVVEPFGSEKEDSRFGVLACLYANAHRKKGQKSLTVNDFFPRYGEKQKQTADDHKAMMNLLVAETKGRKKSTDKDTKNGS